MPGKKNNIYEREREAGRQADRLNKIFENKVTAFFDSCKTECQSCKAVRSVFACFWKHSWTFFFACKMHHKKNSQST